jgi:hypothetical protein
MLGNIGHSFLYEWQVLVMTVKYINVKSLLLHVFLYSTILYYVFRFFVGFGDLAIVIQISVALGLAIYGLFQIIILKKQAPTFFFLSFLYAVILLIPTELQGGIHAVLYGIKDYVVPISLLFSFWFLFNNRPLLIEEAFYAVFTIGFIVSLIYLAESVNVNVFGGDIFDYTNKIRELGLSKGANSNFITGFEGVDKSSFLRMPGPLSHNNSTGLFIVIGIMAGLPMLYRKKFIYKVMLLIMLIAILLLGSRTAWISLIVGVAFLYRNSFFSLLVKIAPIFLVLTLIFLTKFNAYVEMFDIERFYRTILAILSELEKFDLNRIYNVFIGSGYNYPGMIKSDYTPILSDDLFLIQLITIYGLLPLMLFVFSIFNIKKHYRENNFFLNVSTAILICFLITTLHTNAMIRPQLLPIFVMFIVVKHILSKRNVAFCKK